MHFNLADLFEIVVDSVPERPALFCGERRFSYRDLDERANRLGHVLQARGVEPGDHVGLYLYNGTEYLEGMLACYKIRAVPVNVNYRYVAEELSYLFSDADLVAVIHNRESGPVIRAVNDDLPKVKTYLSVDDGSDADVAGIGAVDYETALAEASSARDFAERSPDDLYILYTGGTTGMPKGVMWRQEDIFFAAMGGGNVLGEPIATPAELAEKVIASGEARQMPAAPLMHGAAQWATFIALFGGQTVVLIAGKNFDPEAIWDAVEREKVNAVSIVGDAMGRPLAEALETADRRRDLSSLAVIGSGGAILTRAVKDQLKRAVPNLIIFDGIGASEAGAQGTGVGITQQGNPQFQMNESNTVLDDDGKPIAPGSGTQGRLAKRGRIPLGYYNDEAKTRSTFVTIDGVRWVLPGDIATIEADGTITLFGRGSQCINSGGEKIFPEEVEAALKSHPAVFDAVVVGVPDDRFGQRVAAVVQARRGSAPTLQDVQEHARSKVAGYKIPRELHLVESVQRSPSGKPDYRWAKAIAQGGEHRV